MPQMYKVFVKEVAILVTSDRSSFPEYEQFNLKHVNLRKVVKQIEKGKIDKVLLYSKNEKKLLSRLHKKLPLVLAGGGMVLNADNKYLFIYRNDKWDLPKGKAEKNESIEQTALREVEEETNVKGLEITRYLDKTYHIFSRNGKMSLKLTHWYEMRTSHKGKLKPQAKEGIEVASWLTAPEAMSALTKSYANIRELFPESMIAS